jgi:hypothetical protein
MIIASSKNKAGNMVNDANDILERFVSCEDNLNKVKVIPISPMSKKNRLKSKALENYALENQNFYEI